MVTKARARHMLALLVGLASIVGLSTVHAQELDWNKIQESVELSKFPDAFQGKPPLSPSYMVDNTRDNHGVAPVNGQSNGAVWTEHGSLKNYMKALQESEYNGTNANITRRSRSAVTQGSGYWIPELAPLGVAPHAGAGYKFYRNVVDYGADPEGGKPADEAINAAIQDGDRCGEECGNTFVKGALIYFPPGIYKICTPIIQYYYTQFVGDALDRPILKGCDNFTGIAIVDVDPYVPNMAQPDGTGVNWYINQNQFFRQIRNFVFDMTEMPAATDEHGQKLVPTGIHWQVSQACSLQNLLFKMPTASSTSSKNITHVGVFTENGSGGFVSDLEFEGGAIGWRVGSQQYTAIGLKFKNCITAVQMVWDWGFNWQKIQVDGGTIAFNISGRGGIDGQGIGSVSIIDSNINNVPIGILTNDHATQSPNIVIDNTVFNNVGVIVQAANGAKLLEGGTQTVDLWATGRRYKGKDGEKQTGHVKSRPKKSSKLLDGTKLFTRLRPQYQDLPASSFLIATDHGCKNDATGDNTDAINAFLKQAAAASKIAYFPAGIYSIQGTVNIPVGSKVQGSSWSQVQVTGKYFQDIKNPKVAVRVGQKGDVGIMEIVDMLFTVKGNTAGAIMMEWNIHESSQGSAAMWDSHIRVGGGIGTDLDVATCPKLGYNDACICVSMLLHVTENGSGYFENVWAWVADHDNDMSLYWEIDSSASQISLYGARGILVESQGPCWFYGSGSEHTVLYQYQLYKAKDIYLGHIQTESPYFQPVPATPKPFDSSGVVFPGDPTFEDCKSDSCKEAWGMRVIDSQGVSIHSAGLYSWFSNYKQACLQREDCQDRIMEVTGSKDVAIYNIFAKGVKQIATASGYNINQDDNQRGYTSEISIWLPEDDLPEVVYIGTDIYQTPTAACNKPCIMVLAPSNLAGTTTITIDPYTTSLEVGQTVTTVTLTPKPVTTDRIPFSNVNVTGIVTDGTVFQTKTSIVLDDVTVTLSYTDKRGQIMTSTREIKLPPWPQITNGPPDNWTLTTTSGGPPENWTPTTRSSGHGSTTLEEWPEETSTSRIPPPPPTTTIFPIIYIEPIYDDIKPQCKDESCPATKEDDDVDDHGGLILIWIRCDELWFFNFCIHVNGLRVKGWKFWLPKRTIGPGPPPIVPRLGGWHISYPPPLPPWPVIKVGPGGMTYPKKDPSCDDNKVSVPFNIYTRSYGLSISNGVTVTTTTRTITETAYDTGCPTPEWTATSACGIRGKRAAMVTSTATSTQASVASVIPTMDSPPRLKARDAEEWQHDFDCVEGKAGTIIYLEDDYEQEDAERVYERLDYDRTHFDMEFEVFQHEAPLYVIFIYVWDMPRSLREKIALMPGVEHIRGLKVKKKEPRSLSSVTYDESEAATTRSESAVNDNTTSKLYARAEAEPSKHRDAWWPSQISSYPGEAWEYEGTDGGDVYSPLYYEYFHDDTLGNNQIIYLIEEGLVKDDPDFSGVDVQFLPSKAGFNFKTPDLRHGTTVAKLMVGKTLGLVPKATLLAFPGISLFGQDTPVEMYLIALLQVIQHAEADEENGSKGRCVINMSLGIGLGRRELFAREFLKLLRYLEEELQCVLVNSGGNAGSFEHSDEAYPRFFKYTGDLPNLMVVGATGKEAHKSTRSIVWSNGRNDGMTYAPGLRMEIPGHGGRSIKLTLGTSLSAALVSGLVAYVRALDSKWQDEFKYPERVIKMIQHLGRKIHVVREMDDGGGRGTLLDHAEDPIVKPEVVWNGQVRKENCLLDYKSENSKEICDIYVKDIPDSLESWNPIKIPDACDSPGAAKRDMTKRIVCEPGGGSGGHGKGGGFTWTNGAPSPTCSTGCGTLCTGYYCVPNPTGKPPDYYEDGGPSNFPTLTGIPTPSTSCIGQMKPTTICNGSGGKAACVTSSYCSEYPMPTLTGTVDPKDCPETTTTSKFCNGSGGKAACSIVTRCSPFPVTFTTTEKKVSCHDPRDTCISTSYATKCNKVARTAAPMAAAEAKATGQASSPGKEEVAAPPAKIIPRNVHGNRRICMSTISSRVSQPPGLDLLVPRADSCTTEPVCVCKGPYTTCLNIVVEEFHELSVVFIVKVKENGKITCEFKKQCNGCSGGDEECRDGNRFKWVHNDVWYYSRKEDYTFFGSLSNIQSEKYQCGIFGDCAGHFFSSEDNCKPNEN